MYKRSYEEIGINPRLPVGINGISYPSFQETLGPGPYIYEDTAATPEQGEQLWNEISDPQQSFVPAEDQIAEAFSTPGSSSLIDNPYALGAGALGLGALGLGGYGAHRLLRNRAATQAAEAMAARAIAPSLLSRVAHSKAILPALGALTAGYFLGR